MANLSPLGAPYVMRMAPYCDNDEEIVAMTHGFSTMPHQMLHPLLFSNYFEKHEDLFAFCIFFFTDM